VLSHKTYQNRGICYVTKTFVACNKFPHVKVTRNTKKVVQAFLRSTTEIKAFPTFFSGTNGNVIFSWNS